MRLIDAPIGIFRFDSELVLKTEYYSEDKQSGKYIPDCYIIRTGEYFWGGTKTANELINLDIEPVDFAELLPTVTDTISRQEAIDAVKERYYKYGRFAKIEELVWSIERLPSAQLATDTNVGNKLGTNLAEVGTDCISRQAAIDTEGLDEEIRCEMCENPMHTDRGCDGHCKYDEKLYERIMQILDERIKPLPSAQPEIIRCRECKFASGDSRICMKFDHSPIGELDFCSWAERRQHEVR